jgi:hypothetical protein
VEKRKGLSKKIRFEIFKRDEFACQYCGRTPPSIILEVDHIVAVANGGTDDLINLITACFDCNRGKGAGDLKKVLPSTKTQLESEKERHAQVEEYNKFLLMRRKFNDEQITELGHYWFNQIYPKQRDEYVFGTKRELSIKRFLKSLTFAEILDSIDIAFSRVPNKSDYDDKTWRYFCGICWNMIKSQSVSDEATE